MKTIRWSYLSFLVGAAFLMFNPGSSAAPLTWFPGPQLDWAVSGAATVVDPRLGNVLIGGDYNPYPLSLVVTNIYWTPLSAFPGVSIAAGALDSGDFIVIFGGTDGTGSTSSVFGYSPSGDSPTNYASMSAARSYLGYATVKGNAYAIGGLDDTGQVLASAETFSPESGPSGTWTTIASLPTPRFDFPATTDGTNQIYIFGGYTNAIAGTEVASAFRYSVSKNTWTAIASMPVAVAGSSAAFGTDGKIYVVGGVSGGATINVVQVYDPVANSWTISTPLPEGLSAAAMGVDSLGRLIVMGGMDTNGYDVADIWRSQRLGSPDTAPVLTQFPGTNAAYGVTYTSTIAATGNPQPVYVLVSGPTGMTVDYFTGQITWTPSGADQIGAIPITVAATNYAGATNWTFTINATPPPPTIPTNLTAVAITDYSVTMSWAPESPLVGPATYNVYERHVVITRSGGYATYNKVGSGLTGTSATIAGLAAGSHHTYVVTAVASGIETPYSAMLSITTTSPQPPSNLRLTGLISTTISFAWDPSPGPAQSANYSTITSYVVSQRNTAYSPPVNTAILSGVPGTSATVTAQTPGALHLWIVQGTDAQGLTSANFAYLFVTNPIPVAPLMSGSGPGSNGNFQFTIQEQGSVVQTVWVQANSSLVNPAGWVQISSVLPGTSIFTFTDTNAAQYPTRFYRTVAP